MVTLLRSWLPTAISVAVGIVAGGLRGGRDIVSAHPARAVLAFVAWAVITHILPSPVPKFRTPWD